VDPDDEVPLAEASRRALVATWTNPAGRAGGNLTFSPHNQQIVGNKIYLSSYHAGVYVLDATEAFAGRSVRPVEVGQIVPSGAATRPIYNATLQPVIPFFSGFAPARSEIWDAYVYEGVLYAADMRGGFYAIEETPPPAAAAAAPRPAGSPARTARLKLRRTGGGKASCKRAGITALLTQTGAVAIRRVSFLAGAKRLRTDTMAPFSLAHDAPADRKGARGHRAGDLRRRHHAAHPAPRARLPLSPAVHHADGRRHRSSTAGSATSRRRAKNSRWPSSRHVTMRTAPRSRKPSPTTSGVPTPSSVPLPASSALRSRQEEPGEHRRARERRDPREQEVPRALEELTPVVDDARVLHQCVAEGDHQPEGGDRVAEDVLGDQRQGDLPADRQRPEDERGQGTARRPAATPCHGSGWTHAGASIKLMG